jgi:uncharacterized protein
MNFLVLATLVAAQSFCRDGRDVAVRARVAELAVAQLKAPDARWQPAQQDCAGLVRFAYTQALRDVAAVSVNTPIWSNGAGVRVPFADAETLVQHSFTRLGRTASVRRKVRSGDVLAFRHVDDDGTAVWHLMLAIVAAPGQIAVVYHTGDSGLGMRSGTLAAFEAAAPREWQATTENPHFLGFFSPTFCTGDSYD